MLIFSQDKKNIIEAKQLQIQRNLGGGKDGKFIILANSAGIGSTISMIAAAFPDEKTALDALEKAYKAFADGAKSFDF